MQKIRGRRSRRTTQRVVRRFFTSMAKDKQNHARRLLAANIMHDLFRLNYLDLLRKSAGGTDRYGNRWKPLAESTKRRKAQIQSPRTDERRREEYQRLFQPVLRRLIFAGMSPKAANQRARKIVNRLVELRDQVDLGINFLSGDLLDSFQPGTISKSNYAPNDKQLATYDGHTMLMGSKIEYAGYVHAQRRLFYNAREAAPIVKRTVKNVLPNIIRLLERKV